MSQCNDGVDKQQLWYGVDWENRIIWMERERSHRRGGPEP